MAYFHFYYFFVAMEEIAWGQWFFYFETPVEWAKINRQKETTIHNLEMMGGHNEILRMIFGMGGLIGVLIRNHPKFKQIGASKILLSWFLIIIFLSVLDFLEGEGLMIINDTWNQAISSCSELTEFLIAVSGFLYIFLNFRLLNITPGIR